MKKIIFMFMLMFSFILVNAEETVNVRLEWVPNVYYNYEKDGLNYWGQFAYIYADDKIAYCLDISKEINSRIYQKTDENQTNNLVVLAGYFGYGYDGNVSLIDYMATQKLIWRFLGTTVYFTTKSNGEGETINIRDNEIAINYRINNHAFFPAYDSDFRFIIGSSNNLIQSNALSNGLKYGLINNYSIINSTNNMIDFNKDGLLFNANEVGKNKFYLETQYIKNYDNEIYIADNSQKIMVIGGINNLKRSYSYEVIGGSLNIKLNYNKAIDGFNIEDNIFEIYDSDNNLIGTYSPNLDGNILINNLGLGKYTIKQVCISNGYNVYDYEQIFEITTDSLNQEKNIYMYVKKNNITINKTFSNTIIKDLNYDDGIIYNVYDYNNNYIDKLVTNENGIAEITLEYGDYKIVQSNTNNIDIYHEDIIINKTMFDNDLIFNIHDDINKAKIKILVLDKENNDPICNLNFKINNEEKVTNNNGVYITDMLDFGVYEFSNIVKDGYIEYEGFSYKLDENNAYYIFENEVYVDLVIYLEKLEEPKTSNEQNEELENNTNNNDNDEEVDNNTSNNNNDEEVDNNTNNNDNDEEVDNNTNNNNNDEEVDDGINNIDNNIPVNEDDKFEHIENNDLEQNINEDNLSNETNKPLINIENNNIEKLPFLGENIKQNEKSKIYNYVNYLFDCNWMFFIWI